MNNEALTAKYILLRVLQLALFEIRHDAAQAGSVKKSTMLADLFHNVPLALAAVLVHPLRAVSGLFRREWHQWVVVVAGKSPETCPR